MGSVGPPYTCFSGQKQLKVQFRRVPVHGTWHQCREGRMKIETKIKDFAMDMIITLEEGKKVNASLNGILIKTDQSVRAGGEGSAPEPFVLFLASIGTCAGIYVKMFCDQRGIPTENIRLVQSMNRNPENGMIDRISIDIELPPDFPDKYKAAVIKAADQCRVKKHLDNPPDIEVRAVKP
jgi:putative redox protein